jgi:2-(1,2-epoxy-1,2-dihydrophenyl)acetyl-CoA isomerase
MTEAVHTRVVDGVLLIEMVQERSLNALTPAMVDGLASAFALACEPRVRAVVLGGSGRAFSAGGDVKGMAQNQRSDWDVYQRLKHLHAVLTVPIVTMDKPTVAAVNGVAAGAGMAMALACDVRVASRTARFVFAFSQIGLVPDFGSCYLLPRLVGLARAKELALIRGQLSAEEANDWGLATELTAPEATFDRAVEIATALAHGPTVSLGLTKRMLDRSQELSLHDALELEARYQAIASQTEDHKSARKAFLDKVPPRFSGQ